MDTTTDEEEDDETTSTENSDSETEDELFHSQKDEHSKSILSKDSIGEDKSRSRGGERYDKDHDMDDDESNNIFDTPGLKRSDSPSPPCWPPFDDRTDEDQVGEARVGRPSTGPLYHQMMAVVPRLFAWWSEVGVEEEDVAGGMQSLDFGVVGEEEVLEK